MTTVEFDINKERLFELHSLTQRGKPVSGSAIEDFLLFVYPRIFFGNLRSYKVGLASRGVELGKAMEFNSFGSRLFADRFSHRIITAYVTDLQVRLLSQYPLLGSRYTEILIRSMKLTFPDMPVQTPLSLIKEETPDPEEQEVEIEMREEEKRKIEKEISKLFDEIIGAREIYRIDYYSALNKAGDALGSVFYRSPLDINQAESLMNYYSRIVRAFRG